jgi:hypothetical protein
MSQEEPHKRAQAEVELRSKFTDQERQSGLVAIALCSGNTSRAHRELEAQGLSISRPTLDRWKRAEDYRRVRADVLPQLKQMQAEANTNLATQQMEVSAQITERLANEVDEIPVRDLPGSARNMSVSSAVHTDKARDLRDENVVIVQHRSAAEILRGLARKAPGLIEPAPVVEAEVVEETKDE